MFRNRSRRRQEGAYARICPSVWSARPAVMVMRPVPGVAGPNQRHLETLGDGAEPGAGRAAYADDDQRRWCNVPKTTPKRRS